MTGQNQSVKYPHLGRAHQLCMDLNDIMMLINSSHDIDEILRHIVEASSKALGCESARIAMREGGNWVIRYVCNLPENLVGHTFTDQELKHATLAMTTRKPVAIDDAFNDARTNTEMMKCLGIRSVLVLPLMDRDEVIGTLLFGYHSRTELFGEAEIEYAERLAIGAAIALQDARLYRDLEESKRLGDALTEIDTILFSTKEYDAIMNKMLQLATDVIGAESAVIFSNEGDRWTVRYQYKLPVSLIGQNFSNTEVMHTAITADTKRSLVVQDVSDSPEVDQKFVEMLGIHSLLDFPLILKGEVIGDLTFHHHSHPVPFNDRQVEFARKLQFSITLALENGRLLDTFQQSESMLKEAERLGKSGYFKYDPATRKMIWSAGVFHLFGRDPELGEPTVEEFFALYSVDLEPEVVGALVGEQETSEFDAEIKRGDLACVFHFVVRSSKAANDGMAAYFGTIQDITERKRDERALRESEERFRATAAELQAVNQELETFSYTVAHDLRQPLNIISGYCQAMEKLCGEQLLEDCQDFLREAYKGTLRMNRLIEALLNLSRVGRVEPRREMVDLSSLAHEAAHALKLTGPERQVIIRIADGIVADGDANLLRAVLDNLLGNAWKYTSMREQAVIEFGVRDIDSVPTYFVRDNGAGFDMTETDKLFAPFQRLPGAEKQRGFGIGLATVERIISRHGGKVWAEGEPDRGACIYFTLTADRFPSEP